MPDNDGAFSRAPESRVVSKKRTRISVVWLIPIVAAIAGGWVAVTRILGEGPKITITFESAEGLEAGKTKVEYNGVQIGLVDQVRLSKDHSKVIATVQMDPKTDEFLVDDSNFWIVRPRISGATVSGLGTLISGAYIDMEIGKSAKSRRHFEALPDPPIVTGRTAGRSFILSSPDLGSLDQGTEIFFRHLKVGEVVSYELEKDGRSFSVKVFVNAPYDQYVTKETRFWHASGVDVSLTASGLSVETESLISVLVGGLAFETPPSPTPQSQAEEDSHFVLFKNRTEAFAQAARDPQYYVVTFDEPVRGLSPGAPVEFRGIQTGQVMSIQARLDPQTFKFSVDVTIEFDAQRFGVQIDPSMAKAADPEAVRRHVVDSLVAAGARGQLRSGSLLTGALYVAFDFFPKAKPATVDWSTNPPRLPTTPGSLQAIENNLASIVQKIDDMPLEQIGTELRDAIQELDETLVSARTAIDNANKLVEPNSVLDQQLYNTLQEVSGAARSVRVLADYLERDPEVLLRGKKGEPK